MEQKQQQEQEIQDKKHVQMNQISEYNENYRIAKEWRNITINFSNHIEQIIAFQKQSDTDPSYKVMLYFNNGKYQIWDIQSQDKPEMLSEGQIVENAIQITAINRSEIIYLDKKNKKIKILNIDTHTFSKFAPEVPTTLGIPLDQRSDEKMENLLTDGIQIMYLSTPKLVVVMEQKQQYTNSPQNVITCWKVDENSDGTQIFWQTVFDENEQRNLYFVDMKDQNGTIIIHGTQYQDQPIKYRKHQCVDIPNEDAFKEISTQTPQSCTIISAQGFENELYIWMNPNNSPIPIQITVNLEKVEMKEQQMNLMLKHNKYDIDIIDEEDKDEEEEEEDEEEQLACFLNEIYYFNAQRNLCIVSVSAQNGEKLDIYNPETNKVSFTAQSNCEMGIIDKSFSPDSRFFIQYELNTQQEDNQDETMDVQLTINTIVSIRTSICYFLEKSGIMDIYVPKKNNDQSQNKNQINEEIQENKQQNIIQNKPDLQNEQFLEQVIQALTTGIKQN